MVQEIKAYRDASGAIHENPLSAHRADLALWLAKSEAINQASAQQLASSLADDHDTLDELIEMLRQMRDAQPPRPADAA